jgi:hypothetical protein
MITGGARLMDGVVTRTGEAARADGARTTGCGKPFADTMVTTTAVRGSMTTCGVSTRLAGGTNLDGKTATKLSGPLCPNVQAHRRWRRRKSRREPWHLWPTTGLQRAQGRGSILDPWSSPSSHHPTTSKRNTGLIKRRFIRASFHSQTMTVSPQHESCPVEDLALLRCGPAPLSIQPWKPRSWESHLPRGQGSPSRAARLFSCALPSYVARTKHP